MAAYQKIAIAGATGNLGPSIVDALISAGFSVTVLSRSSSSSSAASLASSVKVAQVDYTSHASLVSALRGQDVLVSTVSGSSASSQAALVDAAIAAGVKRFLPSEFGSDSYGNERARGLAIFADKVETQRYLGARQDVLSYTVVVTGAFLDFGLRVGLVASPKGGKTNIYDGGQRRTSMTLLADVGKAVVGVLRHPEETKNKAVYVQSVAVSQIKLVELARKNKPGLEIEINPVDTAELEKSSNEILGQKDGHVQQAMLGLIAVSIFREGYGGLFGKNDNELLGIKELSDEELLAVVVRYA